MNSISCRRHEHMPEEPNPWQLKYYSLEYDENGNRKLVECECVAPSLADDYSVMNNALLRGMSHGAFRLQTDLVDFNNKLNALI